MGVNRAVLGGLSHDCHLSTAHLAPFFGIFASKKLLSLTPREQSQRPEADR